MSSPFDFIREKLQASPDEVSASTEETPANSRNFEKLLAAFNVWKARKFPGNVLTILIQEDCIENIDVGLAIRNFETEAIPCFQSNSVVEVNEELRPCDKRNVAFSETEEARNHFQTLSDNGYVVILITKNGITYFSRGRQFSRFGSNLFLTAADLKRWAKKRTISEALEVLEEYRNRLRDRTVYRNFSFHLGR